VLRADMLRGRERPDHVGSLFSFGNRGPPGRGGFGLARLWQPNGPREADEIRAAVALARAVRGAGDRHMDEHATRRMTLPVSAS